jgi:hypothetical protein
LKVIEEAQSSQHLSFDHRLARQQFDNQTGAIAGSGEASLRHDIMKAYYIIRAWDRSVSRVIATLLYLFAFAFLAIPSVTTFLRVLVLLTRSA